MDRNPYSPPDAEVRELQPADLAGPRPRQVTWAMWLFWVELTLSGFDYVLDGYLRPYDVAIDLVAVAASLPLEAVVIYKIGRRRNWARYIALGAVILSALLWYEETMDTETERLTILMGAMELVLDIPALVLIFTTPGKQWFR